jgi:hypothetical protein
MFWELEGAKSRGAVGSLGVLRLRASRFAQNDRRLNEGERGGFGPEGCFRLGARIYL